MAGKPDYPSILETNIFFMIIAFLLTTFGAKAQADDLYSGLLITEYIIIMFPTVLFLRLKGISLKKFLKLNPISFKNFILIILIIILSYPVSVFFNYIGLIFIHLFGEIKPNPVPIPTTPVEFITSFLIIALTPGICEEVMFKGLILNIYKKLGKKKSIIYSSILFGIFHFNLQNFLGPIYLGIILGIIFTKTNSLYSSIIGHTANNTLALIIGYIFSNGAEVLNANEAQLDMLGINELLMALIGLGAIALLFGISSYGLIKLLDSNDNKELIELDNFMQNEKQTVILEYNDRIARLEIFPVLIVVILFILLNYVHFFL